MKTARERTLKILLFIEDGVHDLFKLSYQLDIEADNLRSMINGLKSRELLSVLKNGKIKLTKKGKAFIKKNKDRINYC